MMAGSASRNLVARGLKGRSGFTLIEVLVVLSILIILFGMLFAPMIASLDMVTVGQAKVTMQTSARNALTEMRREISNAMYVYPVPGVAYIGADAIGGTHYASDPEEFFPDYSQIAFVSPEVRGGSVVEPLAPRTRADGIVTTVFTVELLNSAEDYARNNPFVLVRKEGTTYQQFTNAAGTVSWWGFDPSEDTMRNVLSPRGSFDIPVTRSICTECGQATDGYITECASGCAGEIIYVHDNVQFVPERVAGETLRPNDSNTLYSARHDAWAGFFNAGNIELNSINGGFMQLGASEFDPRIVMIDPATGDMVRDTWEDESVIDPRGEALIATWNSDRGIVQAGASTGRWINVPDPNPATAITPGQYYPLQVQHERPDLAATDFDAYDTNATLAGSREWDLIPIYPALGVLVCPSCGTTWSPTQYNVGDPCPTSSCPGVLVSTAQPGDPAMPIAYRIDPTANGNWPAAKIVPGSVRVIAWASSALNGRIYQTAYSETSNPNQAEIGPEQFALVFSDFDQRVEVRFSELNPPSPAMLTDTVAIDNFGIYIQYYYRRNYATGTPAEDFVIRADYSTQAIMNLRLALQRYIEPETTAGVQTIPQGATIDRVSLEDQVRIRNLSN